MMDEDELSHEEVKRRTTRGALSVFTRHAAVRGMAFLGTLVLARLIDPRNFGIFAISQFVLTVGSSACVGGIVAALARRKTVTREELRTAFAIQQGLALLVFVIIVFVSPVLAALYELGSDGAWILRTTGVCVFILSLKSVPTIVLQRQFRHDLIAMSDIVEYLTYTVLAVALAYFLHWGVWALVTATVMRHVLAVFYLHFAARYIPRFGFRVEDARDLLRFAAPLQATVWSDLGARSIIPVFVAMFAGVTVVGYANMTSNLVEALAFQPLALLSSIQLRTLAHAQDEPVKIASRLNLWYFTCAAAFVPILMFVGIKGGAIVDLLFNRKWHAMGPLLAACALASLPLPIINPLSQSAKAVGAMRTSVIASLLNLSGQVGTMLVFGKFLGVMALPLAWGVGNLVMLAVYLTRLDAAARGAPLAAYLPPFLSSLAASMVWIALPSDSVSRLGLGLVLAGSIYLVVLSLTSGRWLARLVRMVGGGAIAARAKRLERWARFFDSIDLFSPQPRIGS